MAVFTSCCTRSASVTAKDDTGRPDGFPAHPARTPATIRAMRCTVLAATALALAAPAVAQAAPAPAGDWNRADQRAVMRAGVLPALADDTFHGERPLAGGQARAASSALAGRLGLAPATGVPTGRLSVLGFDALLVRQLGLGDVAVAVQRETRRAGLRPPPAFGTEVVARMLGLRHDHAYGKDQLELYPTQAITRAEAAFSLARALAFGDGVGPRLVREQLERYALPRYSARQRRILRIAVARIGMPYVWGGETDTRSSFFGGQVHGGYDCSGFAWRVLKLTGLPEGRQVTGRTAASQAGEIPRAARIRAAGVAPADLLFFGRGRFWQKATERRITHMGIALSKDFMIQSSGSYGGVSVAPLFTPERARTFSWARRLR